VGDDDLEEMIESGNPGVFTQVGTGMVGDSNENKTIIF
jgi:hypothetical protein